MRKTILTLLFCLNVMFGFTIAGFAQSTLIHYWHFNNFTTAMYTPSIVGIAADYSIHDTAKAKILYAEFSGTSSSFSTYIDPYPTIPADIDTVNARMGQPGGIALRPRNPTDSMYLLFYIPTTHYRNIVFKYATESSSTAHGPLHQLFDYSVDSGATWRTSGLSETSDSAWLVFKLVTVNFTSDSAVNNNSGLVFRIHFNLPNDTDLSGNNRFDNVSVDGDSIIVPSTITTTPATYGPYCNTSTSLISVPFTTTGTFTGSFSLQLSNASGSFASGTSIIGAGAVSPITAAIAAGTAPGAYRVRVINTTGTTIDGTDNGSDIIVNGPPVAYSVTGGGAACSGTGIPVGLTSSQVGVSYQLYRTGVAVGAAVTGTGAAITFGNQSVAGTYTVKAVYTATTACNSTMSGSATVTVGVSPAAITGLTGVCAGQAITLHDGTTGGTWSSSDATRATVGTGAGVVTGVAAGTLTISYSIGGCAATAIVTVNALAPVTGATSICVGASTILSDAVTGGTWSVNNTNAIIGSLSGAVTGAVSGSTSLVTYTTPGGCLATATISINPSPSAIGGPMAVCAAAAINLTNTAAGGAWTSSMPPVATIGSTGMVTTVTGVATGTTSIVYTLPGGCAATVIVTVSLSPGPVSGPSVVCSGTTISFSDDVSGGLWSSGSIGIATIGSLSGDVTGAGIGSTTITYSLGGSSCTVTKTISINPSPAAINATMNICSGMAVLLTDVTSAGTWSSGTTTVATITGTGNVTGTGVGTSTISYTLAGCAATAVLTVNTSPTAITGPASVCAGSAITLTDGITGGAWSSASTTVSVGAGGSINGLSAGVATITYSIGTCSVTKIITVNPVAVMTGPTGVCVGATATLVPSIAGGTWTSTSTSTATVNGSGVVGGIVPGPVTITYTLSTGCITTTLVTVNTLPTAILGTLHVCAGAATALSDGAGGGTWSATPALRATVGLSSGSVTGISAGTAIVTYSLGTGCTVFATVTVNALPLAIGGLPQVCEGLTTAFTDGTAGGTWSISNITTATIGAAGIVSGITAGMDTVSYTIPAGCVSMAIVTVNPLPAPITVSGYVCLGLHTALNDISGGGAWSSSNTALASVDPLSGIITGIAGGSPIITYTLPTTCITTMAVSVNAVAPPITGSPHVCQGLTTHLGDPLPGGIWSTSDTTIATVTSAGLVSGVAAGVITISYITAICPATATVTVNPIPGPVSGASEICEGSAATFSDAGGGTWSSSNQFIASVDPVTGIATGVNTGVATIIYTLDVGCTATALVTIDPLPAPITGASLVCLGTTLHLNEVTAGGGWSSIDPSIATVNTSGLVTGLSDGMATISYTIASGCASTRAITVSSVPAISGLSDMCAWGATLVATDTVSGGNWTSTSVSVSSSGLITSDAPGTATITYTLPDGCSSTAAIAVLPLPGAIAGNPNLCVGLTTALGDTTIGGSWSSSNTAIATVGATGIVTGVAPGVAVITYTTGTGCAETYTVTVRSLPSAISGGAVMCVGASAALSDTTGGGTWSSSNMAVAEAGLTSGVITGLNAGVVTITYDLGASCFVMGDVTVNPLPAPYTVTGGGAYCIGGTGLDIGLSASYAGISYQLYNGAAAVGSPVAGAYSNIDFGIQSAAGVYSVVATNTATSCVSTMPGGTTITINPLPAAYMLTGGGSYCMGGAGVHIGLGTSDIGVHYQLYNGTAAAGSFAAGTGMALDFGLQTTVGTYSVIAASAITGCTGHMADSEIVSIAPLVTPSISLTSGVGDIVCAGTAATFTAATANAGAVPIYQWKVNGTGVSASGPAYTYTPANGDVVKATLISSAECASPDTVSNTVTMTVQAEVTPIVTIAANPGTDIIAGQYDTLTASVLNGGATPAYQWKLNGAVVAGVTGAAYISNGFANGDVVTCSITSSGVCAGETASTEVTLTVNRNVGIGLITSQGNDISIAPNPNKGEFTVKGTLGITGADEEILLEITNMLGQVIYKDAFIAKNGKVNERVQLDNSVANGMYLLVLHSGSGNKVLHVVIEQ